MSAPAETFEAVTTLRAIRAASPCEAGWTKLLRHLGKTGADDEPLLLLTVLQSNGLEDALWVLDSTECAPRLARHFAAWCAEQVLPIFEAARPGDIRPREAIAVARDDAATDQDRDAARDAAWAAAWAAGAAGAARAARAARAAAGAARAARAARAAAWAAGAARAAWAAAWAAGAARAAGAAGAAGDAQARHFARMLGDAP
jgi:hypothetical protein